MNFKKTFSIFALLLTLCAAVPAQTQTESPTASKDEKEKAKLELERKAFNLAERIASDAALLKIAENRAFLIASAAEILWKQDQKRARALFRNAADELIIANADLEKIQTNDEFGFVSFYNSPRRTILQMVAKLDADLALELLVATRSAKLNAELAKQAAQIPGQPAAKDEPMSVLEGPGNAKFLVQEEIRLEQSFAALAAENDPKRAVKLIRDSLSKGVSSEAVNLVKKLHVKDAEIATSLLSEIAAKVLEADFTKQQSPERQVAVMMLRQFGANTAPAAKESDSKKTPLKLDDKTMKDLAGKLADSLMKTNNFTALWEFNSSLPLIEKILPERAAALKEKQAALRKTQPADFGGFEALSLLSQPDAAPDKMISEASKMNIGGMRGNLYRNAADKLIAKNEHDRAKSLLTAAPPSKDRDDTLAYVDSKLAEKAAKDGKFDEARALISKIGTKSAQIEQLVKLAVAFHAKGDKDNRETAMKIMGEVRGMVDTTPQSDEEINDLLQVIAGYAQIDTVQAFAILNPLVDQTNELVQASALLAKYQKRQFLFRDGEMLMTAGLGQMRGSLKFTKELGMLAAADFDKTRDLTDKFQRSDVRLLAQLIIVQSILKTDAVNDNSNAISGATLIMGE